jgi:hypothetical protein
MFAIAARIPVPTSTGGFSVQGLARADAESPVIGRRIRRVVRGGRVRSTCRAVIEAGRGRVPKGELVRVIQTLGDGAVIVAGGISIGGASSVGGIAGGSTATGVGSGGGSGGTKAMASLLA